MTLVALVQYALSFQIGVAGFRLVILTMKDLHEFGNEFVRLFYHKVMEIQNPQCFMLIEQICREETRSRPFGANDFILRKARIPFNKLAVVVVLWGHCIMYVLMWHNGRPFSFVALCWRQLISGFFALRVCRVDDKF